MQRKSVAGTTLPELVTVLTLVGMLVSLAAPNLQSMIERSRSQASAQELVGLLALARNHAVHHHTRVTLCPSDDEQHCGTDWSQPLILFADPDNNRIRDPSETLYRTLDLGAQHRITASLAGKPYFQYQSTGLPGSPKGNLVLCPHHGDARFAQQVVINFLGRVRLATDRDKDGYLKDSSGKPLSCTST